MHSHSADTHALNITTFLRQVGEEAKNAAKILYNTSTKQKNHALIEMADAIKNNKDKILHANYDDIENAEKSGQSTAFIDRLRLDENRIIEISKSLCEIAALSDPVGEVIAVWDRPNGLKIERVRTPLGVIGIIYESRPNVTSDAGALCLKSGNSVILRCGSYAIHSCRAIHLCLCQGLKAADLPENIIQLIPTTDHIVITKMLQGLDGSIDVIVPRGGKNLTDRVIKESRIPVFAHLQGLCHIYVDASSELEIAKKIIINSKMRRTSACGAVETLLIDRAALKTHLKPIVEILTSQGCEVRAVSEICQRFPYLKLITEDDWSTEYLDAIISINIVDGIEGAISHIKRYSSNHTEAIISENPNVVARFFNEIDSAILLHNASTQFADGGEFGMGAEIGIATGKMHARGPVGVEQLTSFKYRVHGNGQIRL
ncbi:Gamma-glutamyl phosphate reductase [Liberibacter crescens BT-1]|uniref:Gamma-glutamyl phosphate reductase n=1 Tax=Liberibacter crescens (strain BT-1) TaxID=1215343 RepID=L0EXU9_LIBCB|nr:glutamate-5-semialdehyde dehydrogenase [Liberibacter crescens]AGA65201.1 Gamma-glutamyl phosphate reductase [Liberibacter crescens BT-1]AMC13154.1 gamma-glutamyl phosphate reductase [Liberibacter crescens]